jgi:L-amino acid N-acyltransferase
MQHLIVTAEEQEYRVTLGGIDITDENSISLHGTLGFTHDGTIKHAAYKFGR